MKLSEDIKNKILEECNKWKDNYGDKTKEERHEKGQFFTPGSLIIKMIEKCEDLEGKFLDCACGNGNILAALMIAGVKPEQIYANEYDPDILMLAHDRLQNLAWELYEGRIPNNHFSNKDAKTDEAYFGMNDFTIIINPPYGRGCPQKKIFKKACEKGKVYSLQPVGSWRTRVGNICELLPLHISKEEFGIAIMPLAIHTNVEDDIVEWDVSKVPTCADLPDGNEKLKMANARSCNEGELSNTVNLTQEPLKITAIKNGGELSNTITMKQPLKVQGAGGGNHGWPSAQTNVFQPGDKQPLGIGNINHGDHIMCGTHIKQPLMVDSFKIGDPNRNPRKAITSGVTMAQKNEDTDSKVTGKNVIYFNTKKERTNFIRNVGKIIPLQMLFNSNIFPKPSDRILPPLDREYSLDELLEYFHFPKDVYEEFNDMTPEEEYRVSYERWKKVREEKYHLTWEEE